MVILMKEKNQLSVVHTWISPEAQQLNGQQFEFNWVRITESFTWIILSENAAIFGSQLKCRFLYCSQLFGPEYAIQNLNRKLNMLTSAIITASRTSQRSRWNKCEKCVKWMKKHSFRIHCCGIDFLFQRHFFSWV